MKAFRTVVLGALVGLGGIHCAVESPDEEVLSSEMAFSDMKDNLHADNDTGVSGTFSKSGNAELAKADNEFFQDLGINGRTCMSCHRPDQGWSVRPDALRARFDATDGLDPIFRALDGASSPTADVSTLEARRDAYSMLLRKGLIRVGMPIPKNAEFELVAVDDPYGYASAAELSLFRRPSPSTNLAFSVTVMWDGRETASGQTLRQNLASQANGATQGHAARPTPLPDATRLSIADFEGALFNAQSFDDDAKALHADGARGGPKLLAEEVFDPSSDVPGFDLYDAWAGLEGGSVEEARAAVARGQAIFGARRGRGTCTFCHSARNVGTNTRGILFDVGIADASLRTPDLPLYTLRNLSTGEEVQTTDPGRALVTGRWRDINRFKVPSLRGLAARAPYFHNGSATTLDDVVDHYEEHFGFTLTAEEQADLVAFLRAL